MNNVQKTRAEHARASQLPTCPAQDQDHHREAAILPASIRKVSSWHNQAQHRAHDSSSVPL